MIQMDTTPVALRGERLHPIWWRGRQWAVTSFGVECLDGTYTIEANRLAEGIGDRPQDHSWLAHMADKGWVDQDDFATAWIVALALHGVRGGIAPQAIRQQIENMRAPRQPA